MSADALSPGAEASSVLLNAEGCVPLRYQSLGSVVSAQTGADGRFLVLDVDSSRAAGKLYQIELARLEGEGSSAEGRGPGVRAGSIVALSVCKAEEKISAFTAGPSGICAIADDRDLLVCDAAGRPPAWTRLPRTLPVDGLKVEGAEVLVSGPYFHVKRGRYALYFDAEDEDAVDAYVERFHRLADGSWASYSFESY